MGLCSALQWEEGEPTMIKPMQFEECDCYKQGGVSWYGKVVIRGCLPRFTNQALRLPSILRSIGADGFRVLS
jgi:hypothetical protein